MWVTTGSRSLAMGFSLFFLSLLLAHLEPSPLEDRRRREKGEALLLFPFCFVSKKPTVLYPVIYGRRAYLDAV
jgi:hypothetical protein